MTSHDAPAQDEPRTPAWLTALGALLLLAVAIWWLAPGSDVIDATIRVPAAAAEDAEPALPQPTTIRVPAIDQPQERPAGTVPVPRLAAPRKLTPSLRIPPPNPRNDAPPPTE